MIDFSRNFKGPLVTLRARNSAAPQNTYANMNTFNTSTVRWASIFDAAYTLDITSSSADDKMTTGTGAWEAEVYGLDANWNPISEVVELNGQTVVTTTKTFRRVFELVVQSAGTGLQNAGDIYVIKHGTGGSYSGGVPPTLTGAAIKALAGDNFGLSGLWTAPRGTIYTLASFSMSASTQAGTIKMLHGYPLNNNLIYARRKIDFAPGMPISVPVVAPILVVNEKEDVYFQVTSGTAGAKVSVEATFVQQGV